MSVAPRDELLDVSPLDAESLAVVAFEGVSVWRSDGGVRTTVLDDINWTVRSDEHWGIIGANGAGKTTLVRVAAAQIRPSSGSATILGGRLGRVSMPALRRRIGFVEPAIAQRFYPDQRALDVVLSGMSGTILLTDEPDEPAVEQALELLRSVGMYEFSERTFASCSEGERVRILLARALAAEASFLALDEACGGPRPSRSRAPSRGARERDSRAPGTDDTHGHPPHRRAACDHVARVALASRLGGRRRSGSSCPHRHDLERMLWARAPGRASRRPFFRARRLRPMCLSRPRPATRRVRVRRFLGTPPRRAAPSLRATPL